MSRILRVNDPDGEPIGSAESIPGLARLLEDVPPGRYHIDEISHDPLAMVKPPHISNQPISASASDIRKAPCSSGSAPLFIAEISWREIPHPGHPPVASC